MAVPQCYISYPCTVFLTESKEEQSWSNPSDSYTLIYNWALALENSAAQHTKNSSTAKVCRLNKITLKKKVLDSLNEKELTA